MILVFGGTTEGRAAVKVIEEGAKPYLYSTLSPAQKIETPSGEHISGAMTADSMRVLCSTRGIRLIVDAAHPFAEKLHATVAEVAGELHIPVIRYERRAAKADTEGVIWCDSYDDAVARMEQNGVDRLLILTGVRTIPKLKDFWLRHNCRFRILDREESIAEALSYGVPRERIIFYDPDEAETDVWRREAPQAVITKESGYSGRFPEKVAAARQLGIPLYAVRRPQLSDKFICVYTESGLRRRIEDILPDFFPLRSGYTTGAYACAAASAALHRLIYGSDRKEIDITLPKGEIATLEVHSTESDGQTARATVIKVAGDDPDVTNGCEITAAVTLNDTNEIRFLQGAGVGRVTLEGLGIPVGEPAINPAPRQMIRDNFASIGVSGADITISVRDGELLAQKTFNPRLGIVGGISIIGTSGIVRPFSNDAFVESVRRSAEVAAAAGCSHLVINSGAKSETILRREFPDLPPQAFVQYGNFIGETLKIAAGCRFSRVTMGIMVGKAVKLAEGHLDTHSRLQTLNRDFLVNVAEQSGCSARAAEIIRSVTLARELQTSLSPSDCDLFFPALLDRCMSHCRPLLPDAQFSILLISEEGAISYRI